MTNCAGTDNQPSEDQSALISSVGSLKIDLPTEFRRPCSSPKAPTLEEAKILIKVRAFSVQQEGNINCEYDRAEALIAVIDLANKANDDLQKNMAEALKHHGLVSLSK